MWCFTSRGTFLGISGVNLVLTGQSFWRILGFSFAKFVVQMGLYSRIYTASEKKWDAQLYAWNLYYWDNFGMINITAHCNTDVYTEIIGTALPDPKKCSISTKALSISNVFYS